MTQTPAPYPPGTLPRYLAPVPQAIEDLGLQNAWVVVLINLLGATFGFWFYGGQFTTTAPVLWPWIPDSPLATLFAALAITAWKLGNEQPWLTALAFVGNLVLGLWTPFTLLVFAEGFGSYHPLFYQFLVWSHLAMVAQALVLYRISRFSSWGIGIAAVWYWSNLIVDYFIPIIGTPHHTIIPVPRWTPVALGADALDVIAAAEVTAVLLAVCLAFFIRIERGPPQPA